jgi:hypothetical protein
MRRREFIARLGSAAAWPVVARAQTESMRRVAVLSNADDDATQALFAIFSGEMAKSSVGSKGGTCGSTSVSAPVMRSAFAPMRRNW